MIDSAVIAKLGKLIPLLSSNRPGEVNATATAIGRTLRASGLDFHDLAAALSPKGGDASLQLLRKGRRAKKRGQKRPRPPEPPLAGERNLRRLIHLERETKIQAETIRELRATVDRLNAEVQSRDDDIERRSSGARMDPRVRRMLEFLARPENRYASSADVAARFGVAEDTVRRFRGP